MNFSYKLKLLGGGGGFLFGKNLKGIKKAVFQPTGFCYYNLISLMLMYPFEKHLNTQENIMMCCLWKCSNYKPLKF